LGWNAIHRLYLYVNEGHNSLIVVGGPASALFINNNVVSKDGGYDLEPKWAPGPYERQSNVDGTPFAACATTLPGPGTQVPCRCPFVSSLFLPLPSCLAALSWRAPTGLLSYRSFVLYQLLDQLLDHLLLSHTGSNSCSPALAPTPPSSFTFFPLTNSCALPRGAAASQVHGVTIGSLPANAVSYYESGDVSVIFSIPTVSFCMGQGDEDHVGDGGRPAWPALRVRVQCVAAPPTRGRDRAPTLRSCQN
jgi:hypothetical protein